MILKKFSSDTQHVIKSHSYNYFLLLSCPML